MRSPRRQPADDLAPLPPPPDAVDVHPTVALEWQTGGPIDPALRSPLANQIVVMAWGFLGFVATLLAHGDRQFIPLWFCVPLVWLAITAVPFLMRIQGRIRVGADGIELRWLRFRRFVSFREVKDVVVRGDRVEIERHHGRPLRVRSELRFEIADSARRAMNAFRPGETAHEAAETARGSSGADEWLERLERLVPNETGYREAPLDRAGLLAVVLNGAADPSARAGSAYALARAKITQEERDVIGAAARATVHPKVRVALAEVAEAGDESRVRRALRAVRS